MNTGGELVGQIFPIQAEQHLTTLLIIEVINGERRGWRQPGANGFDRT